MARGWESKSVEAQQDAAAETGVRGPHLSAEEAARHSRRATLMLARTKALSDLQMACASAHRSMLEHEIAEIDRLLAVLG
jgi:hypothetical protein